MGKNEKSSTETTDKTITFEPYSGDNHSPVSFMSGSSHIQSVLIGVEYQNCCRTLDLYLLIAIWMGQIQSKLTYIYAAYRLTSI